MRSGAPFFRLVPLVALAICWPSGASAQQGWDRAKEDCDKVLSKRAKAKHVARLRKCAELWETHREVDGLSPKAKKKAQHAFSVLYYAGGDEDKDLAYDALRRMGVRRLKRGQVGMAERGGQAAAPASLPEVSASRKKSARGLVSKGLKLHKRKKFRKALSLYERAIKADPNHLSGHYNAACASARLGDVSGAVDLLGEIRGRGTRAARRLLMDARTDKDFRKIRHRPEFKQVTGYAEIVLLNGAGAEGQPHVRRLKRALRDNGRKPAFVGTDEASRGRPLVWYKAGFEAVAEEIKNIVEPDKTKLKLIDFNTAIGRYDFDIYAVWGMPHKAGLLALPEVERRKRSGSSGGDSDNPLDAIRKAKGTVEDAGSLMKPPALPELP